MAARKPSSQDPEPNQDLPEPPEANQDLPEAPDESPADDKGERGNRGKSEDARGHNKPEHREDPNTYPDPDNPPHTP